MMEDGPTAEKRCAKSESVKTSYSRLLPSKLHNAKEAHSANGITSMGHTSTSNRDKAAGGQANLLVMVDNASLKQETNRSLSNVKINVLPNSANTEKIARKVNRVNSAVVLTRVKSQLRNISRVSPLLIPTKTTGATIRKAKSTQTVTRRTVPLSKKIKQSTSTQPLVSQTKLTIIDNVNPTLAKSEGHKKTRVSVKQASNKPAIHMSFRTPKKSKVISLISGRKRKSQPQKPRSTKEKSEGSDSDHIPSQTTNGDWSRDDDHLHLTKTRGKSTDNLKLSNSNIKSNREIKPLKNTISSLKLLDSKLLSRSASEVNGLTSIKTSSRPSSSVRLSLSKLSAAKNGPSSLTKAKPLSLTSRKTKIVNKLQKRTPCPQPAAPSTSHRKTPNLTKPNTRSQVTTSTKPLSKIATNQSSNSTSRIKEADGTSLTNANKQQRMKSQISNNANANNVNNGTGEKSQSESEVSYSFLNASANDETVRHRADTVSFAQFLDQKLAAGNSAQKRVSAKRRRREAKKVIETDSLYKPEPTISTSLQNTCKLLSTEAGSGEGENMQDPSCPDLYHMCFMKLVESDEEEDRPSSTSYISQPNVFRHKVRFDLQNSNITLERLRSKRSKQTHRSTGPTSYKYYPPMLDRPVIDNLIQLEPFNKATANFPASCTQMTVKNGQSSKNCSNIWTTILKSRKWKDVGLYTLSKSPSYSSIETDDAEEDSEEDSNSLLTASQTDVGCKNKSESRSWSNKRPHSSTSADRKRKKRRGKTSRQKLHFEPSESSPHDVVFPPYSLDVQNSSASNANPENMQTVACSTSTEIAHRENEPGLSDIPVLSLPPGNYKKSSMVQLKWIHLVDFMTKEVTSECQEKGYEFLQRLCRGNPRVHSLVFLASNKCNPAYTPVEVTAIRLPYAYFTSSVVALAGTGAGRHYIHNWVTSLPPHQNLLMLLHRFCTPNWVYYVTQHCAWPSLDHLINQCSSVNSGTKKYQGLKESACKTIFKQICAGMEHLHELDILHGDLNCSNVLVSSTLQVKLAGYGPVCQRMMSPLHTVKGYIQLQGDTFNKGTPPELMTRRDNWTKSCDVWCMGITLLQMVIGEIPAHVNTAIRLNGTSSPVTRLHLPHCGYQLSRLVDKILQPCPSNRPSVFHISNHPWLSDGKDLVDFFTGKRNKNGIRRTDGSTYPLPKRLQNRGQLLETTVYSQSELDDVCDSSEEVEDEDYSDTISNSWSREQPCVIDNVDFYETASSKENYLLSQRTQFSNHVTATPDLIGLRASSSGFGLTSATRDSVHSNTVSQGTSSLCLFSPKQNLSTFQSSHCDMKLFPLKSRSGDLEIEKRETVSTQSVFDNSHREMYKGCDLLKLMETLNF